MKNPETYITANFQLKEFACHDELKTPYPYDAIDVADLHSRTWGETRLFSLCMLLEKIRLRAGNQTIIVDSGYRTIEYDTKIWEMSLKNGDVASPSLSQHPKGRAADIKHETMKPHEMFNLVLQMYEDGEIPELGGIGLYSTFIHVDIRPKERNHLAIWGGARPSNVA